MPRNIEEYVHRQGAYELDNILIGAKMCLLLYDARSGQELLLVSLPDRFAMATCSSISYLIKIMVEAQQLEEMAERYQQMREKRDAEGGGGGRGGRFGGRGGGRDFGGGYGGGEMRVAFE
ncbi:hypothetical protein DPMN_081036 [Dreissena polymorpha]|uniref:Uncharacterized protein n=1 Tax=Dreissena polymorpha TaxID=45954 RepID=A0A9D3Y7W8_DREPO|nr:hypothetical protein DPMN_081036 [Dreissena polymorpha]